MGDPIIGSTFRHVKAELVSAMSALHMEADLEPGYVPEHVIFMDESLKWVKHAQEHLNAAMASIALMENEHTCFPDKVNPFTQEIEKKQDKPILAEILKRLLYIVGLVKAGQWSWFYNRNCKYVNLMINMRDGSYSLTNRDQESIIIEEVENQEIPPKRPERE